MKDEDAKVLTVAQEITFTKALSSNDKYLRDRALKRLKQWLLLKSKSDLLSEASFMRLWKGLFYCLWMADKPLVQEDTAENISYLIHSLGNYKDAQTFIGCFFQAISQAWFGLDQHRLDKFMMLIRRVLRQSFEYISQRGWNKAHISLFSDDLYKSISLAPVGMNLHVIEVYLEELAKVGKDDIKADDVVKFVTPFAKYMADSTDPRILSHISNHIFLYLIRQSKIGVKEQLRFNAWRQLGFPGGSIEVMEEVKDSESEDEKEECDDSYESGITTSLDARAGNVDVLLSTLPFTPQSIVELLCSLRTKKETTTKARKCLLSLITKFSKLASGDFPLGVKQVEIPGDEEKLIQESLQGLLEEEMENEIQTKGKGLQSRNGYKNVWEVTELCNSVTKYEKINVHVQRNWEVSSIRTSKKGVKRKFNVSDALSSKSFSVSDLNIENEVSSIFLNVEEKKIKRRKRNKKNMAPSTMKKESVSFSVACIRNRELEDIKNEESLKEPNKPINKKRRQRNSTTDLNCSVSSISKEMAESSLSDTPGEKKKVAFVLNRNMSQGETDYQNALKNSPSIPYDAAKRPSQGVLKTLVVRSPINPFYRPKMKNTSLA